MKTKITVWIPAIIATVVALLLLAYYMVLSHGSGEVRMHAPGGVGRMSPPEGEGPRGGGEIFKTLGMIAVFLGAVSFSWFWFKKKLRSPSMLVRKIGKILHAVHKLMGWATLSITSTHGFYFLITKPGDKNMYTGLAALVILLMIAGYGLFIQKIRNKWMRTVHRWLGLLWVPILLLHAGGSTIVAVIGSLAVGALVWLLEKIAVRSIPGER